MIMKLVIFVLVQILPGLTFPQRCTDFLSPKRLWKKTALFIGLEVGSFKSFLTV